MRLMGGLPQSRAGTQAMSLVAAGTIDSLADLTTRLATAPDFTPVAEALRAGQSATIDGAWASSKALALAALLTHQPRLLVVVLPHSSDVEPMIDDMASFGDVKATGFPAIDDFQPRAEISDNPPIAVGARTALVKAVLSQQPPRLVVATMQSLLQPIPSPDHIRQNSRTLRRGQSLDVERFERFLIEHGWERQLAVEMPCQFSQRGGILDLYSPDADAPIRVELFGDEIESIREFSIDTQRSLREIESAEVTVLNQRGQFALDDAPAHLADCVPVGTWFALVEPQELKEEGRHYLSRLESQKGLFCVEDCWARLLRHPTVILSSLPVHSVETTYSFQVESIERFSGEVTKVREELDRAAAADQVLVACHNEAEAKRLSEVFHNSRTACEGRLRLVIGALSAGFRWVPMGVVAVSDHELFHRTDMRRTTPRRRQLGRAIDSFLDLADGDYVVHLSHGIGIFRGMTMLEKHGQLEEHLTIEFADGVFVYVPATKIDLVQKYVGSSQSAPRLSKVGGQLWERRKETVRRAVHDLASELIDLQAAREAQPGYAFPQDSSWQEEFESAFEFVETEDQLAAMEEIRRDMERPRPADRLLCGDVGYGKTELAMRAAFKAVDAGKQVAVLVPTTVLAQQHFRTFHERMAEYPFVIECLSRFQSKAEQRSIVKRTAEGAVDILIGTHRLISADVAFHDLGLVIIDEEQRFGVEHKERLKQLRRQVDVLTMTATPIPRTLHSALLGIRDISNLETPPADRLAVETRISRLDPALIRHAVLRELNRDGQVYFVHNRVQDIGRVADRLTQMVPEARIVVVHGQMPDDEIEDGMIRFLERKADVLLATTIIESGLDIPNANTMFINDGDKYGLADLHQLRGRVGRSAKRAYCYILLGEDRPITHDAQRRLKAIEEYSGLGAGFQIALRDLEIRGAGNIVGKEQSGHIAAVGYELYCQLLERAVRRLKKLPIESHLDVTVELPWKAYLPTQYLPGERFRIDAYRRLARARSPEELNLLRRELVDRFGSLPVPTENLLDLAELRILAQTWQIESIRLDDKGFLVMHYRNRRNMEALARRRPDDIVVADARVAYLNVANLPHDARKLCTFLKRLLQPM
jgi:transcription-repair coupling factor (superfamily II helicase)